MASSVKYILLDSNKDMCDAWNEEFLGIEGVSVVNSGFVDYMNNTDLEIDGIVSPANSFGIMDGGYDAAITEYFGTSVMRGIQNIIKDRYRGIQPVGMALSMKINDKVTLLHVPTMYFLSEITDIRIVFQCMLSTLIEADRNGLNSIIIPAFGNGCGKVRFCDVSRMMKVAYDYYMYPIKIINWDTVEHFVELTSGVEKYK